MAAEEILLYASTAVLNLVLAILVARTRPRRPGNGLLTLIFALNAAFAAYAAAAVVLTPLLYADPSGHPVRLVIFRLVSIVLNYATLVPLALLPFVLPWPRVGVRARRAVLAVALILYAVTVGLSTFEFVDWARTGFPARVPPGITLISGNLLIHGGAVMSTILFLDATLAARGPLERRIGAVLLAGSILRVASTGIGTVAAPLLRHAFGGFEGPFGPFGGPTFVVMTILFLGLVCAALAVPAALLVNRLRGGVGAGSVWADLLVVAMLPVGLALAWVLGAPTLEYLLVRPIILAYAILQFQMLGTDVRRSEGLVGTGILAALLSLYILVEQGLLGFVGSASAGLALVATLGVAGVLAIPFLRIVLHPTETDAPRRILVYRAALEAAHRGGDASASETLKALRRELGVSDREHELLAGAAGATSSGPTLIPGEVLLGRYRVVRPLGQGASGEVVLARDERLQRDVAIKRLAGHVRRDARAIVSFEREMRLASALHHPNVVAVHDVETIGDDAFLVMEYAPGGSLQDRIERDGRIPESEARRVATDLLAALGALHAKGIVHRDVKPSNVLLDASGRAKLADFTVARDVVSGETVGGASDRPAGTWAYMSPEQARGLRATAQSDLYSLAATIYTALAGKPPVSLDGADEHEARMRIAREPAALPLAGVSASMNETLARGLARSTSDRFRSAEEMAAAIA